MQVNKARGIVAVAAVVSLLPVTMASSSSRAAHAARPYDVNCDGRSDLVVSAPMDEGHARVYVAFRAHDGWKPGARLMDVRAETLASGDFDADGCADVVTGYRYGSQVSVYYGHHTRPLTTARNRRLPNERQQSAVDVAANSPYPAPGAGDALAVGDFNGDGFSDLAIGFSNASNSVTPLVSAGATFGGVVAVRYGGPEGLYAGTQLAPQQYEPWDANSTRVPGGAKDGERFGESVAAGDLNGDGVDDLTIGISGRTVDGIKAAGSVTELFGSTSGLTADGNRTLSLDTPGVRGRAAPKEQCYPEDDVCYEVGEQFGYVVATGDLDGDGYDDAVIGVPNKAIERRAPSGALSVLYGGAEGLTSRSQFFSGITPGMPLLARDHGAWALGLRMAVDDFNADGYADIAAALPIAGTGLVLILPGGPRRVTLVDARRLAPPDGDHHVYPESFGNSLTSFDSNGDHVADLVAGAATSNVRSKYQAGVLYVLPGGVTGLSMADSRCFRESSPAFGGRSRHDHRFGYVGPSAGIFDYP